MTTFSNMGLTWPDVSVTVGPTWASEINTAMALVDAHDHSSGKGVKVTPAGFNINADLSFNTSYNATDVRSVRLASQSAVFSIAADVNAVYVKSGELYFRDASGNNVQITSGGLLNATLLTTNTFAQQDVNADVAVTAGNTSTHFSIDASVGDRTMTLPKASDVTAGRYYIFSDRLGSCSSTTPRIITIQREGTTTDLIDGASSITINSPYGAVLVVRTSSTKWKVFPFGQVATGSKAGGIMLAGDLSNTYDAPRVSSLTGSGGIVTDTAQTFVWSLPAGSGPLVGQLNAPTNNAGAQFLIQAQRGASNGSGYAGGNLKLKGGEAGGTSTAHGGVLLVDGGDNEVAAAIYSDPDQYLRISGSKGIQFGNGLTTHTISSEARTTSGNGGDMEITAQAGLTSGNGGSLVLSGGAGAGGGKAGGYVSLVSGHGSTEGKIMAQLGGVFKVIEAAEVASTRYVVGLNTGSSSFTSTNVPEGSGVVFLANAATAPTSGSLPTGGNVIYSESGYVKFMTSAASCVGIGFNGETTTAGNWGAAGANTFNVAPTGHINVMVGGIARAIPYW